jgi:hypothetical protein
VQSLDAAVAGPLLDLAERQPETLLQASEAWWQAMAVVRAEWADAAEFTRVRG